MGYQIKFNCLLTVSKTDLSLQDLVVGQRYNITKDGERLYPLNIPIEVCDDDHVYYGKVAVRKLTLEAEKTSLEFEVLKIFSPEEAKVYTNNFIEMKYFQYFCAKRRYQNTTLIKSCDIDCF